MGLAVIEILMDVEDVFGITIQKPDFKPRRTLGDLDT